MEKFDTAKSCTKKKWEVWKKRERRNLSLNLAIPLHPLQLSLWLIVYLLAMKMLASNDPHVLDIITYFSSHWNLTIAEVSHFFLRRTKSSPTMLMDLQHYSLGTKIPPKEMPIRSGLACDKISSSFLDNSFCSFWLPCLVVLCFNILVLDVPVLPHCRKWSLPNLSAIICCHKMLAKNLNNLPNATSSRHVFQ